MPLQELSGAAAEEWVAGLGTPHHCSWHGEANEGESSAFTACAITCAMSTRASP